MSDELRYTPRPGDETLPFHPLAAALMERKLWDVEVQVSRVGALAEVLQVARQSSTMAEGTVEIVSDVLADEIMNLQGIVARSLEWGPWTAPAAPAPAEG